MAELNHYLKALNSKAGNVKPVVMASSRRKDVWNAQHGKCVLCKRDLRASYCKYTEDPKTRVMKIICSDCAVQTGKRN